MQTATVYLDDFAAGDRAEIGAHTFDEAEIVRFAREFDPQSFHVDRAAAEASMFGGLIASGWHTCAVMMRILCDGAILHWASIGSPGVDELRWKRPVRPGDTLRVFTTVHEVRPSKTKPDRGILVSDIEMRNQQDEVVLTVRTMNMLYRRPTTT